MKQNLSSTAVVIVLTVAAIVIGVALYLYFKPSIGEGPPLTPKPWRPPGAWGKSPATEGKLGAPGRPSGFHGPPGSGGHPGAQTPR